MNNEKEKRELALEAFELIKEYTEIISPFLSSKCTSIEIDETLTVITITYEDNEQDVCSMDCIGDYCHYAIYSIHPGADGPLLEELQLLKSEFENKYKVLNREKFIEFAGRVHYAEYRCVEICDRLDEIEDRYGKLN